MINRVLIRVKVVQLLYSYVLQRTDFKMPEKPGEDASRDTRYAYEFFLDILRMVMEMNGVVLRQEAKSAMRGIPTDRKLRDGEIGKRLWGIEAIRQAATPRQELSPYDALIPNIYKEIPTLPAYKSYIKQHPATVEDEVELWKSVIYNLIEKNKGVVTAARRHPLFTFTGFHRGVQMMIDLLQSYNDNRSLLLNSRSALSKSLEKARELYLSLLYLPLAIVSEIEHRQDEAHNKLMPSDADLHPNLRLVENKLVKALRENEQMIAAMKGQKIEWNDDYTTISSLIKLIEDSDLYKKYMSRPDEPDYNEDCAFWEEAFKTIILPSDTLAEKLESASVFWNDDLQIMGEFVLKTLHRFAKSSKDGQDVSLLPMFKDKEDEEFGPKLFMETAKHYDEYRDIIARNLSGTWEADRVALMDMVAMTTAVSEMLNFPSVPVAVTLNEYVEVSGDYSTDRSRDFVNAVLRQVADKLREEGKLQGK